jgi:DNA replication protein DnaC
MTINISWEQLERNTESKEIGFESFNFQIAYALFKSYGKFEYDYNTPGSEFYLTITKDCPELSAKLGDVIGWQAKFWLSRSDPDNTSFEQRYREELIAGFKKTLEYKNNLKTWIICTPGKPANTAPYYVKSKLESELKEIKPNIEIIYWNKVIYEAFFHEHHELLGSIYKYYFSTRFIGFKEIEQYTQLRIKRLNRKYDADIYTPGEADKEIGELFDILSLRNEMHIQISILLDKLRKVDQSALTCNYVTLDKEYIDDKREIYEILNLIGEYISEVKSEKDPFLIVNHISHRPDKLISRVNELLKKNRKFHNVISDKFSDEIKQRERQYSSELQHHIDELLDNINKVFRTKDKVNRNHIHIFGSAGTGKTNLAVNIASELLKNKMPALLIRASEIKGDSGSTTIYKQIVDSMGFDPAFTLRDVLGCLDNLGNLKRKKIPIIIDGLNETSPTAVAWSDALFYISEDVKCFDYIIVITTCRSSYAEQIFGEKNVSDIKDSLELQGFTKDNVESAIDKYFAKYKIKARNTDFNHDLFQNPLLLKMFAEINENSEVLINQASVLGGIDGYVSFIAQRAALENGSTNRFLLNDIEEKVNKFAEELWLSNVREIDYPKRFFEIFDPQYQPGTMPIERTISHRIIDEGLLVARDIDDKKESAAFVYDMIGGLCIAKAVVFKHSDYDENISSLRQADLWQRLTNTVATLNHPLAEDIIRSLIFLCKQYTNKAVFEIIDNPIISENSSKMLEVVLNDKNRNLITGYLLAQPVQSQSVSHYLDAFVNEVAQLRNYENLEIINIMLQKMTCAEINLVWCEVILRKRIVIMSYLNKLHEQLSDSNVDDKEMPSAALFLSLLLSSTDRFLRDKATKCLVFIGEKKLLCIFNVFQKVESIADIYITERMIASLCGAILRGGAAETAKAVRLYLKENYFNTVRTTHIIILDYINVIISYLNEIYEFKLPLDTISNEKIPQWLEDEDCMAYFATNDPEWGYKTIQYDFARYTIGHIANSHYQKNQASPNHKQAVAMVYWRMLQLGYKPQLFDELDRIIVSEKNKHNYDRHDNSSKIDRYGKKYSWIAYFELYGYLMLNNRLTTEYSYSYRQSDIDIDPTFPNKPRKVQLFNRCLLPAFNDDVQSWINLNTSDYLKAMYVQELPRMSGKWVLLNSGVDQEERGSKIHIYLDTYLVKKEDSNRLKTKLNEFRTSREARDYYYMFAGEIPWARFLESQFSLEGINVIRTCLSFNWESYHSQMNDTSYFPFLSPFITCERKLKYDVDTLGFRDEFGNVAAIYLWDKSSFFYYIREDILNDILKENSLQLVFHEYGTRYGEFREHKKNLNPSYNDFSSINVL